MDFMDFKNFKHASFKINQYSTSSFLNVPVWQNAVYGTVYNHIIIYPLKYGVISRVLYTKYCYREKYNTMESKANPGEKMG
jgi:hypothetical protein